MILGYLVVAIIVVVFVKAIFAPDTNSTSYRLGKGVGNKTRKFGEWLTRDD